MKRHLSFGRFLRNWVFWVAVALFGLVVPCGGGGQSHADSAFTVTAQPVMTLNAGLEADGLIRSQYTDQHAWVFGGSGFTRLEGAQADGFPYPPKSGMLTLKVTTPLRTVYGYVNVISDTMVVLAKAADMYDYYDYFVNKVFGGLKIGDRVTVEVFGKDPTGTLHYSNPVTLTYAQDIIEGGWWSIRADLLWRGNPYPDNKYEVARGDCLFFDVSGWPAINTEQRLRAPGIWEGTLPFATNKVWNRCFMMETAGTYTIYNDTQGTSMQIIVKNEGIPLDLWEWVPRREDMNQTGLVHGFGGARIIIPPGAMPYYIDRGTQQAAYTVGLAHWSHSKYPRTFFDPAENDGGHVFRIEFRPEPRELLQPVTIILPYKESPAYAKPSFAIYDETSRIFYTLHGTVDPVKHTITYTLPAGKYPPTGGSSSTAGPDEFNSTVQPLGGSVPPVSLNKITRHVGIRYITSDWATIEDPHGWFQVDYITDPSSSSYVTDAYAQEVLDTLVACYSKLTSLGWTAPSNQVYVKIRDYYITNYIFGKQEGHTSKVIFGTASSYIQSTVPQGNALRSVVAHECTHVFQRVLTRVLSLKWIDEASAEWGAFATVGNQFQTDTLSHSTRIPTRTLPTGFYAGYSAEEGYAAQALILWLAYKYGDTKIADIYKYLDAHETMWYDSQGTFEAVFGTTIRLMMDNFARDYWTQNYPPLQTLNLDTSLQNDAGIKPDYEITDYSGVTLDAFRPALSSVRYTVEVASAFKPTVSNRQGVVRAKGLDAAFTIVWVYGDTVRLGAPGTLTLLATLTKDSPNAYLGRTDDTLGSYTSYRVIISNAERNASATIMVTLTLPQIKGLSPSSGSNSGGYSVSINGSGFGTERGEVRISGFLVPVTSWSDSAITFTMPNMGTALGSWDVKVSTKEGAVSNATPFNFTN